MPLVLQATHLRSEGVKNDELQVLESTYMAGFDAAMAHTGKKARKAGDPPTLAERLMYT